MAGRMLGMDGCSVKEGESRRGAAGLGGGLPPFSASEPIFDLDGGGPAGNASWTVSVMWGQSGCAVHAVAAAAAASRRYRLRRTTAAGW